MNEVVKTAVQWTIPRRMRWLAVMGGGKRKAPFYASLVCRTCADPSPQPAGLEVASEVVKTEVQWTIPLGMRWLAVMGGEG